MRIAIFHDYIGAIGGGEKLVLTLASGLGADVITTDVDEDSVKKMGFEDVNIISLGETVKLPPLKQISASLRFAMCDFSKKYDFFIFSGNWAHFAARRHKPNLYYCHTPVRAFYDLYDIFLQRQSIITKPLFMIWVTIHRPAAEYYMKHVDRIAANSKNTQLRIKKYLHRDAEVIYPPIDTLKYYFKESDDFWLSVNRLYPEKRVELQIEAFRLMPEEKLIIVGGYAEGDHASKYAEKIKHNLPENVEMHGTVAEKELIDLYARCRGLVATAVDEDFGMTPIEAMAAGKPVICVREGGYTESVLNGVTGLLVEPEAKDIIRAINIISKNLREYKRTCVEQAGKFDISIFIKRMKEKTDAAC
ncbi:MAG: glycosyltransferase [Candidatus Methanoperedens sp.]|nr:glycosyltransferase [Candidatus Methanoperedens sp.]